MHVSEDDADIRVVRCFQSCRAGSRSLIVAPDSPAVIIELEQHAAPGKIQLGSCRNKQIGCFPEILFHSFAPEKELPQFERRGEVVFPRRPLEMLRRFGVVFLIQSDAPKQIIGLRAARAGRFTEEFRRFLRVSIDAVSVQVDLAEVFSGAEIAEPGRGLQQGNAPLCVARNMHSFVIHDAKKGFRLRIACFFEFREPNERFFGISLSSPAVEEILSRFRP